MYESFFASVGVVLPMMLLMLVGFTVRVRGIITRPAMREYDKLIFKLFMPLLLFKNIYEMDSSQGFMMKEMIFAAVCLIIIFVFSLTVPKLITKDGNKSAVIGQAIIRANYVLFGTAVSEAIFGEGNIGIVVMIGVLSIPAVNVFSAIILELNRSGKAKPFKLFIAVLNNPMIVGAIFAFIFKGFSIHIPAPVWSVIRSIANSTTTISFISLGVGLDMARLQSDVRPLIWGVFLRMIFIPLVFMPLSVMMGFKGQSLCAMMIIFAAPPAVASYPMAVAMGADGDLAGQLVCITTILSVLTIFLWTLLLKTFALM